MLSPNLKIGLPTTDQLASSDDTPVDAEELAQQEQLRAQQEQLRAEKLAQYLRSLGIDPDNLPGEQP
ncbi:hypothetical protein F7734_37320 [Scytonema sp. UIC 10036]|uniref:hypothetical protein n=1 Tax=Scytonema sp. UIC 10036 TaxID=2304196 RepID=UPI0012DA434C|nr:hypothetical protein [Scytonema sp. UIC 10036]MUG97671.1 hypothetical protein [Scytonema sp. UIC 10036]